LVGEEHEAADEEKLKKTEEKLEGDWTEEATAEERGLSGAGRASWFHQGPVG
jgi:hypothetical protein